MPSSSVTKSDLHVVADGLRETIRENAHEIVSHVQTSQTAQDQQMQVQLATVNRKLDGLAEDMAKVKMAVVDLLATDRHLHNLVRELKSQNISLDEGRIFAAPRPLRLTKVRDTLVESLYYDHYTAERCLEVPPKSARDPIALTAPLVLPAGARVIAREPRSWPNRSGRC